MADERNVKEQYESHAELLHGRQLSEEESLEHLARFDVQGRANWLDRMKAELEPMQSNKLKEDTPTYSSVDDAWGDAQRVSFYGRMIDFHEKLRKAGR